MNNTHISSFVYHGVLIVGVGLVSVAGCATESLPTQIVTGSTITLSYAAQLALGFLYTIRVISYVHSFS